LLLEPLGLIPRFRFDLEEIEVLAVDPDLAAPLIDRPAVGEGKGGRELQNVGMAQRIPFLADVLEMEQMLPVAMEHEGPGVRIGKADLESGFRCRASRFSGVLLPVGAIALLLRLDVHVVVKSFLVRFAARPGRLDRDEAQGDQIVGLCLVAEFLEEGVEIRGPLFGTDGAGRVT